MAEVHRIRVFDYVPSPIVSISLNEDKSTLLVARYSGYVEIWNVAQNSFCMGQLRVTTPDDLHNVCWCRIQQSPAIAASTLGGELYIFGYPSLRLLQRIDSKGGTIWCLAVNQDQTRLALACDDGTAKVYTTEQGLEFKFQTDHFASTAISVCFDPSGAILMGDATGRIARADGETGRFITQYKDRENADVTIWCIVPVAGGAFATGDSRGCVVVWDPVTATVLEEFRVHQEAVCALAACEDELYAAGIDPTVAAFSYNAKSGRWAQIGSNRFHINDVTGLAVQARGKVISASKDSTLCVSRKVVMAFQNRPPIASAMRDGAVVVAGGAGSELGIWRMDGQRAYKEVRLRTADDEVNVETVAISKDGCHVAYSASGTRTLTYDGGQWSLNRECHEASTALCYSAQGVLYRGTLNGDVVSDAGKSINVGFPVFRIAISNNGQDICAGGLGRIVVLSPELDKIREEIPALKTPFSTFEFQPRRNRLFIACGDERIQVYNILKHKFLPKIKIGFGQRGRVAANTILFDPKNRERVFLSSSKVGVMTHLLNPKAGFYRFPYNDILFIEFVAPDKIVIYEKPWVLFANSLPKVFRAKRFQTSNEDQIPRY